MVHQRTVASLESSLQQVQEECARLQVRTCLQSAADV
jgi:hypothetical protein